MRIGRNVPKDYVVFLVVDRFFPLRFLCREGQETFSGRNIDERDRIESWVNVFFHNVWKIVVNPGVL